MVDAPVHMRRASVLALSGLCLALPRAATAAEPPPLPAESEPSLPPADAGAPPAGDAPPALPEGGAGTPETPPATDTAAPTEPAPAGAVRLITDEEAALPLYREIMGRLVAQEDEIVRQADVLGTL